MSPLLAGCLVLSLFLVPMIADIGIVNQSRARAESIADAASLAAAQEMVRGGDPAAAAADYVTKNGGALSSVVANDQSVTVTVQEDCPTIIASRLGINVGPARGRGKAELKEIDEPDY